MKTNNCTIIIAPQAFKGSLTAFEVADAMSEGVKRAVPHAKIIQLPIADGGDGTLEILLRAKPGEFRQAQVLGPLGEKIDATWGFWPKSAFIGASDICGLRLLPKEKRNPASTTTYGMGQLIKIALDEGAEKLIIGLGGSATHDAGSGLAQAVGVELLDKKGRPIPRGGLGLKKLASINLSGLDLRIKKTEIIACCDCLNPLTGPVGAAHVYAPQKGASPSLVEELEEATCHFAERIKSELGLEIEQLPGAGAAGGTAAALFAFLGAKLEPGSQYVLRFIGFKKALQKADLVLTGEGCMDSQTHFNKAPGAVAEMAKEADIPVLALVGSLGKGFEEMHRYGIGAIIPLSFAPAEIPQNSYQQLVLATEETLRCYFLSL